MASALTITKKKIRFVVIGALLALTPAASSEEPSMWPGASWETGAAEAGGFDSAKLALALDEIRKRGLNIHSLLVVRHGRIVLDATFYPYDGRTPHNLASVTKSVMTTLIAIAADQGKLKLDQPALDFFPGKTIANRDERKQRITVRHLAGMTSGLDCVGEHDEPTLHQMNASADWVQFTLDLKMVAEPGTVFSYCSPGMHLLSAILQQATGMTTLAFAKRNLFEPLAIEDVIWPVDPQGINTGWGDLHLLPQDAAKVGYLWLHGGAWNGRQIVSKAWVEQSSRSQIKPGPHWGDDYGYGWWVLPLDEVPHFVAAGRGGQQVAVFPSLDAVTVTTGAGFDPGEALDLVGTALASGDKPLPENVSAEAALQETVSQMMEAPAPEPLKPLPDIARQISGKVYRLEPNLLQLQTIRLDFKGSAEAGLAMSFSDGQPPRSGRIGLDGIYRMSPGEGGLPAGMRGAWVDAAMFRLTYDAIANIDAYDLKVRFDGDRIIIAAKERTYESGIMLTGVAE